MQEQPKGSHFIGGEYVPGTGASRDCLYPATAGTIAELRDATADEVAEAVATARAAFKSWRATPAAERARILRRAADILRARNDEISQLETLDTGKAIQETLIADAASGADCLEYFAGIAATMTGEHVDLGGDFGYTRREPLGVVVGIGAWNYPIQIACWKAAPALAAGNTMVFKPSELTPLNALNLAEILTESGLPDGVFNVVQGGRETGAALVSHPDVAKVSLTGEAGTGRKVMAAAAPGLKHVTLELGGKSPILVFDDARLDNAVGGALLGNFFSSGQVCSNGTRVLVQRGIYDRFVEQVVARAAKIRLGDPLDPDTHLGPMVSEPQLQKVSSYLDIGRSEADLLLGGNRAEVSGFPDGWYVEPTIFTTENDNARIVREEIFGPVMTILPFDDEEEGIRRANDTEYGLAAAVFTQDVTRSHRVIAELEAGTTWINTYNLTPIELPFGGYGQSGIGRENSRHALDHYSQIKSVYVAMGDVDAPY